MRKNGRKKHKSSHLPEYLSRCLLMSYHMRLESFKSILVLVSGWINQKTVTITSNCIGFMWSMYVNWAVWLEDFRTYEVHLKHVACNAPCCSCAYSMIFSPRLGSGIVGHKPPARYCSVPAGSKLDAII